jgi:ribosome-associated heat shock protein Hsp15
LRGRDALIDTDDRQRIDKWLWHARLVRTRTMAAALVAQGHVRLNGRRVTQPGKALRVGDVVTVRLDGGVRTLRIVALAARRGGSAQAAALFRIVEEPSNAAGNF